jgi:NAD(P)H-hydrate epimerase
MAGAARLAAEAALRTGAGIVSVSTWPEHQSLISAKYPEIMCHGVTSREQLTPLIEKATVIVIGPGLGQDDWARMLLSECLGNTLTKVVDADALNLLGSLPQCQDNWILTPHPGEAARLLNLENAKAIQNDRFDAIRQLATLGGNWILKGAGSLVKCNNQPINLCPFGNPGMASGGMGDALSGILGSLIAQKIAIATAIKMGVLIHALAGDLAAKNGQRGLLASDLIEQLRTVINP